MTVRIFLLMFFTTWHSLSALGQNKLNGRLFYLKPPLFNSKSKVTTLDLSGYQVTVALPVDNRAQFYGEVVYAGKTTHAIEDFLKLPAMEEVQNKIKADIATFVRKKKTHAAHGALMINTQVEVFYPKMTGFINAKSFTKVRLVMDVSANGAGLMSRKYECLYVTDGTDKEFEGDLQMTVEDGENVTLGMALRKTLDQFYASLQRILALKSDHMIVYGRAVDAKTKKGLPAVLTFKSDSSFSVNSSERGEFELVLPRAPHSIQAIESGYLTFTEVFDPLTSSLKMVEMDVALTPIETGAVINLKNVLFQVGTTNLLAESFPELDGVAEFLRKNPKVRIELQGHTDNQGNAQKDQVLSQERVNKIKGYLLTKGISSKRIRGKGFGASRPLASNETEEGRRLNRRVEFVILRN